MKMSNDQNLRLQITNLEQKLTDTVTIFILHRMYHFPVSHIVWIVIWGQLLKAGI